MGFDDSLYDWPGLGWDEHGTRPSLLLGNGFSQNIWPDFNYNSLFKKASLTDRDRAIFKAFKTDNFEMVLNVLAISKAVSGALDQNYELLESHENRIRKILLDSVNSVHANFSDFSIESRTIIADELAKYMSIYYTNYDLLIYWSIMQYQNNYPNHFFDYFWSRKNNKFDIQDTDIWNKEDRSGIYFLHGGLHLYKNIIGKTFKQKNNGRDLLGMFGSEVPLFISEGTFEYKLQSIHQSDYLSFLFSCFEKDSNNPLVILGHSLGCSDQHIANAINAHTDRPVAISVRKSEDIRKKKAAICAALPQVKLFFFDAATHPLLHKSLCIQEAPP